MTVVFGDGVAQIFESLPLPVQKRAGRILDLLAVFPAMYPVRRRGLMKGYRYYSVSSHQIRLSAIIPGRMRRA